MRFYGGVSRRYGDIERTSHFFLLEWFFLHLHGDAGRITLSFGWFIFGNEGYFVRSPSL